MTLTEMMDLGGWAAVRCIVLTWHVSVSVVLVVVKALWTMENGFPPIQSYD